MSYTQHYPPRRERPQQQRHVVNGRLVSRAPIMGLDLGRCLVVVLCCLALWFSNPAKNQRTSPLYGVGVTNYGFFSILDSGDRVSLNVATLRVDCHLPRDEDPSKSYYTSTRSLYENEWYEDLYFSVCTQIRKSMAHRKPLVWAPRDFPHTVHRILCATLVLMTLLVSCRKSTLSNSSLFTGNLFVDSVISMFVNPQRPLEGLFWGLVHANLYLYPVWTVMNKVIPLQSETSFFRVVEHPMGVNFGLSVAVLFGLAVAMNAGSTHLTGENHLLLPGLEGLVAIGFGYYRAMYGSQAHPPELQWWNNLTFLRRHAGWIPDLNATSLTWLLLVQVFLQRSVHGVIAFVVSNMIGFNIGNYQRMNLSAFATFGSLFQELREGFASLFY